jgi:hypothetical protein
VFINLRRWYEKKKLRKLWFWKAMLEVALVLHPAITSLAALWQLSNFTAATQYPRTAVSP